MIFSSADLRVSGNSTTTRISYTNTSGHVLAKDGLTGTWYDEYTNPSQYAASPYIFLIRTGTTVSGKAGLGDSWITLNGTPAADIRISDGGRITYTNTSGHVFAKDWLGGTWYDEYTSPDQYAASDSLFVIRLGTTIYGKVNLGDSWTALNGTPATDVRVSGNRITYTDTNGHVWAKDYVYGTWYDEYTNPSQYATGAG